MPFDNLLGNLKNGNPIPHYYGDMVRFFFLFAAVIMLVTLPFVNNLLPVPLLASIFAILFLALIAGLTNPSQKWTAVLNSIVAISGFVTYEYYAVNAYLAAASSSLLFITNQTLAIVFLLASYFATKTLRSFLLGNRI